MDITFQIAADLAELSVLQARLQSLQATWLLPGKTVAEINLVLEELVANIIEHGKLDKSHIIDISLTKLDLELTIMVRDDGPPFDPTGCASPDITLPLEKRKCGGLGIHLVRHLCECCSYIRASGKNIITVKRTLPKECR
jgi:anti-sigma regulatory factor (Ser/Thr protein kinase)